MRTLRVVLLVSVSCSVPMLGQTDKGELFGGYSSIRPAQLDYERQRVPVVDTGGPTPIPPVGVNGLRYSAGIILNF